MVTEVSKRWVMETDNSLRVLVGRIREISPLIKQRAKLGQYNLAKQKRILSSIRKAGKLIAEVRVI